MNCPICNSPLPHTLQTCIVNMDLIIADLLDPISEIQRYAATQRKYALEAQQLQVQKIRKDLGLKAMYTPANQR